MNLESFLEKIPIIVLNFGIVPVKSSNLYTCQLTVIPKDFLLHQPSHTNCLGISAKNVTMSLFSTFGKCLSKLWISREDNF